MILFFSLTAGRLWQQKKQTVAQRAQCYHFKLPASLSSYNVSGEANAVQAEKLRMPVKS